MAIGKLGRGTGHLGALLGKAGTPANLPVGGFKVGDAGTGIYSGFTLAWAEDFLFSPTANLIGPSTPKAKYGATRIYSTNGRRGDTNILGTMYDADPLHTGYNDANYGVPFGFTNYNISNSVLQLQARKATTAEQAMFSPTAAGINGGVRNQVSAMWHTADSLIFTPGTNTIVYEARVRYDSTSCSGWHPDIWAAIWNPVNAQNGNNWNLAEGSSQYASFGQNPYTGGTPGGTGYGGNITSIYDNSNFHTITIFLRNGGNVDLYIDGVLFAQAVGVNANPLVTPIYALISSHVYNAGFNGDSYSQTQWDAPINANGASIWVDWVRVWSTTGVTNYAPLSTISDLTVAFNGTGSVVLPSATTLWNDATVSEYVQQLSFEGTQPGNTATTVINRFMNGVSYTSGTRTLAVDFQGVQDNAGSFNIAVGAYKNGAVCVPAVFSVNRGPQLMIGNITATAGSAITPVEIYRQCDVGNNLPKTISITGLPPGITASNDGKYTLSGTPTDTSGTTSVTITDSLGVVRTRTITWNNYQAETNVLISRFTTRPSKAETDAFDAYISGLKSASLWSTLYQLTIFALDDVQSAHVNWITTNSYWLKRIGSPTFTANAGFTTNGTSTAIDTGFNVGGSGITGITNNLSVTTWSLTAGQTANGGFGAIDGAAFNGVSLSLRNTSNQFAARMNDATADAATVATGAGMFTATRRAASGAACKTLYQNGAKLADFTTASTSAYSGNAITIGETIGVNTFASRQWAMFAIGTARSDADETTFYNLTRTLMTALGVP